jgi:hypothetical protein
MECTASRHRKALNVTAWHIRTLLSPRVLT